MKLLVVGCGQCGGRLADEFAKLNTRARTQRGMEIITDSFAVNTDMTDLSGLYHVPADYKHRIVIGNQKTSGHGVGKVNEVGAEIAREESDRVIESMREGGKLHNADAILVASSAAGGTGSGAISVLTQHLKAHYPNKPVYNLIVLPFKYEEQTEARNAFNAGTCLKSSFLVADAVFLVDNQRFIRKSLSLRNNLHKINSLVVEPFYNLLCAGEESNAEYVGSRVLDAGDIIQTLSGWTAIGHGTVERPLVRRFFRSAPETDHFRTKATEAHDETRALHAALDDLSLKCSPTDAHRALYLICAPHEKMNMDIIGELNRSLKEVARNAVIRSGDYPRRKRATDITIILSELTNVARITEVFSKAVAYMSNITKHGVGDAENRRLEEAFKDIPTLIQ